jgi:hypothetical protein
VIWINNHERRPLLKSVHIGKGLDFDATALATSVTAFLGIRGSGKSTTAGVVAEGLMDAGIPVIVIDQVGPWFGLRLQPDGKTPSRFKVPVLGGAHGDIVLSQQTGRQVAEALAASRSSAVLDISMMRKGERIRFCADFAEAFLDAKKRSPGAVSIVLEEAQDVVPQIMRFASPDMARCLGAFEDIASVGRNFGIGLALLSLRPQKLNKEVLNLAETVFGFRMLGVLERKAIAEWVQEKGADGRADVAGELPSLGRGQAIVWSPSVFGVYGKHRLDAKTTYDASSTPGAGRAAVTTKPLDLAALESSMAAVVADAKANDPRALKARIVELERTIAKGTGGPGEVEVRVEYRCPKEIRRLVQLELAKAATAFSDLQARALAIVEAFPEMGIAAGARESAPRAPAALPRNPDGHGSLRARTASDNASASTSSLGGGERKILTAIAQHANGVTREQLTVLTGYKRSSRDTYLQRLRSAGVIDDRGDRIVATDTTSLGPDFEPLPTGEDLRRHWLGRLPVGERKIFEAVVGAYPGSVSRSDIDEATGFKRSSRDTYLQRLSSRQLVITERGGDVTASAELF